MHRDFNQLKHQDFDVLVCGGGIYGAWTAYDAALRGLRVAIVDKGDWGSGTSSASSKLIHGGLRYLESLDFKLVKKSLAEREMLLKAAPHRIWPLRFGIPLYDANPFAWIKIKMGLLLYDFLAGKLSKTEQHLQHNPAAFMGRFSQLDPIGLKGGFTYFDAQTDDARYVLELIDGAASANAVCISYCEVIELIENKGKASGAVLQDKVTGESLAIAASQIVDTTGRHAPLLQNNKSIRRLTKGIHLVMPGILNDEALLLRAQKDDRVFFMIPWYGLTLLGTTDTDYDDDCDDVVISDNDIDYLLTAANNAINNPKWTKADVIGQFAGLRVLQQSARENPSNISRDWALETLPNGLLCSIGGKLTSAREDAATIVDKLCNNLGFHYDCQTFGKAFPWLSTGNYSSLLKNSQAEAKKLGIDQETVSWLVKRHGTRISKILKLCADNRPLTQRIRPELPFILADLVFCAGNEAVVHLDDLLRRRIPLLILTQLTMDELRKLAKITAEILLWDEEKTETEINRCWGNYIFTHAS